MDVQDQLFVSFNRYNQKWAVHKQLKNRVPVIGVS
jgi:hypothetical protein